MRKKNNIYDQNCPNRQTFLKVKKKNANRNGFFLKIVLLFCGCFIFFKMSLMNFGYSANQRRTSHI